MNETVTLLLALTAGFLLGVLFFGGLWWTIQKGVSSQRPALWFFGSLLLRMGITLTGFYLVADGRWERLTVSLLGFIMARLLIMRLTRAADKPTCLTQETSHAT